MYTTIHIENHQFGLWFRDGQLMDRLGPGVYRLWKLWGTGRDHIEVIDVADADEATEEPGRPLPCARAQEMELLGHALAAGGAARGGVTTGV